MRSVLFTTLFCLFVLISTSCIKHYHYHNDSKSPIRQSVVSSKQSKPVLIKKLDKNAPPTMHQKADIRISNEIPFFSMKLFYVGNELRRVEAVATESGVTPYKVVALNPDGAEVNGMGYIDQLFLQEKPGDTWKHDKYMQPGIHTDHKNQINPRDAAWARRLISEGVIQYYKKRKTKQKS